MRLAEEGFPDAGSSPLSLGIPAPPPGSPTPTRIIPALAGNTIVIIGPPGRARDHPRSRGEYFISTAAGCRGLGSSPLSRGIRRGTRVHCHDAGIIPALAGNTHRGRSRGSGGGDHPRSRGEYTPQRVKNPHQPGSSPLSRGIPPSRRGMRPWLGIIPALAGNTGSRPSHTDVATDHPRSRGEYRCSHGVGRQSGGSSPLSRGILLARGKYLLKTRIIPALAGNTSWLTSFAGCAGDHPRSRGEYPDVPGASSRKKGSSPLSRGIQPPRNRSHRRRCQDHPRSRGEYAAFAFVYRDQYGSSPLSRGIHHSVPDQTTQDRIIPALAGNTSALIERVYRRGDHPRSRGEYELFFFQLRRRLGSSPLSRGIPPPQVTHILITRIIPALAGNTREWKGN